MTLFGEAEKSGNNDDGGSGRRLIVETDGGSRGNPGHAGYGALVRDPDTGKVLAEKAEYLGKVSNNVAEYSGLVAGLELALQQDPDALIHVKMDSKLVVEQMSGRWKIKHADMRALATKARSVVDPRRVTYEWIPREVNTDADRLSNEAMDAGEAGVEWKSSGTLMAGGPEPVEEPAGVEPEPAETPSEAPAETTPEEEPELGPAPITTPMPIIVDRDPEPFYEQPDPLVEEFAQPAEPAAPALPSGRLHHIELWVEDFAEARTSLGWIFERLGYQRKNEWESGASWQGAVGYIVLESGPDVTPGRHERKRPGMNHLAFWAGPPSLVDAIVRDAPEYGWKLMYEDQHPYAGGSGHYAAYLENEGGFEVELVATPDSA
ncbi:reverse transcriptase-like protein [Arthrobacter monumenti]